MMTLAKYTGYLAPWRPVIAAMALCGQTPMQIGRLVYALGARQHWELRPENIRLLGFRADRESSAASIVRLLLRSWELPLPLPAEIPHRRKVRERYEWTPESNWHELQAVRAEG